MKKLNNKGYLTIEIILAAVIAFTIAFFLIEVTVNFSNASDNYYTDTIFITDKALVSNNVKKDIQNDINDNGIITNAECNNSTCTITYNDNTTKELKYNSSNNKVEYDTYSKEIKNLTFKSIDVYGSYNEGDYIRFVISFDNVFTSTVYDINILIYNGETENDESLVEHIVDLYDNDEKSVLNSLNYIDYHYAKNVGLMNDRLGDQNNDIDGGNIRYYGANPNNYINIGDKYETDYTYVLVNKVTNKNFQTTEECQNYFSCSTNTDNFGVDGFSYDSEEDCYTYFAEDIALNLYGIETESNEDFINTYCKTETIPAGTPILWRIIGVFDGKVRIVRDEPIGAYSWDTTTLNINEGKGINQWGESKSSLDGSEYKGADLMKLLNPGYEENQDLNNAEERVTVNNSLWWNSEIGKCYNGRFNRITDCDFTNIGLSESVKSKIVDQTISLGGYRDTNIDAFVNELYQIERDGNVYNDGFDDYFNDNIARTT